MIDHALAPDYSEYMLKTTRLGKVFRQNLQRLMQERNWSQSDFAEAMGCSQPYISQLLSGVREPGLPTIEKVARIFGISPTELLVKKKSETLLT